MPTFRVRNLAIIQESILEKFYSPKTKLQESCEHILVNFSSFRKLCFENQNFPGKLTSCPLFPGLLKGVEG